MGGSVWETTSWYFGPCSSGESVNEGTREQVEGIKLACEDTGGIVQVMPLLCLSHCGAVHTLSDYNPTNHSDF